jgi:hypothetical protein
MSLELTKELWNGIKPFFNAPDAMDAAEVMVNVLIDHDYTALEISDEFKGDQYVRDAVAPYLDEHHEFDDEDDDFEFDEEY